MVIGSSYRGDIDWILIHGLDSKAEKHLTICITCVARLRRRTATTWYRQSERDQQRRDVLIDDTMSFQGSCWFMTMRHFRERLYPLDTIYGTWSQEPQEIGLKTWLGGGRIVSNKKTWYAHLHKGARYGRGYFLSKGEVIRGHELSARYWMGNKWPNQYLADN